MASVRDLKVRELTRARFEGIFLKNESELVRLLESQENPLDQPVLDINIPVLTPQPLCRVQRFKEYAADKRQIFKNMQITNGIVLLTG